MTETREETNTHYDLLELSLRRQLHEEEKRVDGLLREVFIAFHSELAEQQAAREAALAAIGEKP